jgi:hypothetical protein
LPVEIAYLDPPRKYYVDYRADLEGLGVENESVIDDSLKGSYILELENAIRVNSNVFKKIQSPGRSRRRILICPG